MPVEADFRAEPEPVAVADRRPAGTAVAAGDEMQLELFGG